MFNTWLMVALMFQASPDVPALVRWIRSLLMAEISGLSIQVMSLLWNASYRLPFTSTVSIECGDLFFCNGASEMMIFVSGCFLMVVGISSLYAWTTSIRALSFTSFVFSWNSITSGYPCIVSTISMACLTLKGFLDHCAEIKAQFVWPDPGGQ